MSVVEAAVTVVEWAVTMDEDGYREEDGAAKTSSCEASGTVGSGPSSTAQLLHGRT